jgi:hypothetical protein
MQKRERERENESDRGGQKRREIRKKEGDFGSNFRFLAKSKQIPLSFLHELASLVRKLYSELE